ncbi:Target of rapamycin complex 1 subunit kog1 [Coemansia spiralis]|nr:Target of rapamycin complex 1 subunit kog1 [Coemansia spiralis]
MADRRAPVEAATPAADQDLPMGVIKTVSGVEINVGELIGGDREAGGARAPGQTVLDGRQDFHTHPRSLALGHKQLADWRTHEKLRTVGALLVICLNLGIDPPGVPRPKERAVLEAWVDPNAPVQAPTPEEIALHAANGNKSGQSAPRERAPLKAIGENLQRQYELIHRHAKYKTIPDCTLEDLPKYCKQYRRMAKDERLLFHYNGHGVPYPSASGDIWVFNKHFTQYIPVSATDLMGWIGTPCVYVWDCSNAMNVVRAFQRNANTRDVEIAHIRLIAESAGAKLPLSKNDTEGLAALTSKVTAMMALQVASGPGQQAGQQTGQQTGQQSIQQTAQQQQQQQQQPHGAPPANLALINLALLAPMHHEDIHFAACGVDEVLPTNPELPADLFTSCLTTPVKAAVRFWVIRNPRTSRIGLEDCEKLTGSVQDRRTPMGELNWIFTSITDTIAWNTLPRELFRKLFRQDVLVASLYRNFMLADRIMRYYGVHPECSPALPPTHKHPLWDSLDLEIDMCLAQLPRLLEEERVRQNERDRMKRATLHAQQRGPRGAAAVPAPMDFEAPIKLKLEIAGEFKKRRQQHSRAYIGSSSGGGGIGGGGDSDDSDSGSGYDSDGVGPGSSGLLGAESAVTGYISSTYFSNQLYAFEVWLQHAATVVSQFVAGHGPDQTPRSLSTEPPPGLDPPGELPAVLQVLLSQQYRLRALILLYRFMNLGPWAVDLAMAVGIYPYMTKLLGSTTPEIREILILVWARLVAVDPAMHPELLKNDGLEYFAAYLANNIQMQSEPISDKVRLSDRVSAASAFTLAMLCRNMKQAQHACFNERVLDYFLVYLQRPDNGTEERANLRTWILMCLAELWREFSNAKWMAMTYRLCVIASKKQQQAQEQQQQQRPQQDAPPSFEELLASSADDDTVDARDAHDLLIEMAFHRSPTVRAAAVYAMGTLLEELAMLGDDPTVLAIIRKGERQMFALLLQAASDGSPVVRLEVAAVIGSAAFASYMPQAVEAVGRVVAEDMREHRPPQPGAAAGGPPAAAAADAAGSPLEVSLEMLVKLYKAQLRLSADPHPDVASVARAACDVLMQCYVHSRAFLEAEPALDQALQRLELTRVMGGQPPTLDAVNRSNSSIGDALLGLTAPATGPQQPQPQLKLPQRGQRARNAAGSGSGGGGMRLRDGAPAHHRYTMHVPQGSVPHAGLFGGRSPPTPRSPSAAGSISAASLTTIEAAGAGRHPAGGLSWLAGLEGREREEAMQRIDSIEQAWLEWGRLELRENACASTLLDWAGACYTEFDISLFADVSGPLQSSVALVEARERNRQARRVTASARVLGCQAGSMKWADVRPVGATRDPAVVAILHPLEPHAIVAGARGTVAVFDWEQRAQVGQFDIAPRAHCREAAAVSSLHLINPLGQARLLVGTQDGSVRIYASHAPDFVPTGAQPVAFPRPRLLSAFVALPWASQSAPAAYLGSATPALDRVQRSRPQGLLSPAPGADGPVAGSVGLATAWNQCSGTLFVGGDAKEVRVWDVAAEMCVEEIAVSSMGGVTCIGSSSLSDTVFVVGTSGGVVRVVDRRLAARQSVVATWRDHAPNAVRSVRMRLELMEVVSAGETGCVKTWDLRHKEPVYTLEALADAGTDRWLVAMDAHENASVTLTASESAVRIWNQRGKAIGVATAAAIAGRSANSTAAAYMKSLAGYGPARAQTVRVSAAALHTYLPVALLATDDGRVGIVQASQGSARPVSMVGARAHSAL